MPSSGGTTGTPIVFPIPGSSTANASPNRNLLPLETYRKIMGLHPLYFWGFKNSAVQPTSACNGLLYKYSWQAADAEGRQDIAEAIHSAEEQLLEYLKFYPAPRYKEMTMPWPQYHDAMQSRYRPVNGAGLRVGLYLPEGYIQAIGTELLTSLGSPAVTVADTNADGIIDTFTTAPLATAVTDETEIAAYFKLADRNNEPVGDEWRVLPIQVTISAGFVTIKGPSWIVAQPALYEAIDPTFLVSIDPNDAAKYVTHLDLYQRTTYTEGNTPATSQGVLLWDTTEGCGSGWCFCANCTGITYDPTNSNADPAAIGMSVARVGISDPKLGRVIPANAILNATSGIWYDQVQFYREPDRALIRYLAGYPLNSRGEMDHKMQVVVARLATAIMGRPINGCDEANREMYRWQFDVARAAGANDEQYSISPADLDNPFGTRRGEVWAWKQVKNLHLQRGLAY